jgi:hypothetical protein
MRPHALVEAGDLEAIDLFIREEDAQRSLEECLSDERSGAGCCASKRSSCRPIRCR